MSVTDTELEARVESPCVRICTLDDDDICLGCFRDIGEICAWARASEEQRRHIVEAAQRRRQERQARG